jgi:poly(A) polymerase
VKHLPDAHWRTRPGMAEIIAALGGSESVRFVGGAVRDTLCGLPASDVDLATVLTPPDVIARLEAARIKAVPTGIAHGTITAVSKGTPVEVTTLRRDVSTDGRRATVWFTADWREDAARRDFTINALYANPETGEIFDFFGGLADLSAGRVAFIGAPLERIAEDHLRILRFFRFHARFGQGPPDPEALDACAARANDLMALSRERIADELLKLLAVTNPVPAVRLMIDHAILKPVLPEIEDAALLDRLVAREGESGIAGDPVRRLAALIGPRAHVAESIATRLRLSKAKVKRLVLACTPPAPMTAEALAYRRGLESAVDALLIGESPTGDLSRLASWSRPALSISGGDLIARGLTPGPVVAQTLGAIEAAWIDAGFPDGPAFEAIVSAALSASAIRPQS